MLSTLSTINCLTRLDLNTHHIVSYNKPLVLVDDFLKTTLKYNFGTELSQSASNYKISFNQLLTSFRTPYQPLVNAYLVLFKYLGIKPVAHPVLDFLTSDRACPIQTQQDNTRTIGQDFQDILEDVDSAYHPLANYWLTHNEDLHFYTREHVWSFICPPDLAQAAILLPNYTPLVYNSSKEWCTKYGYDLKVNMYNDNSYHFCNEVNFLTDSELNKRTKRWDSSYVCGWPIVSAVAKIVGGECTTNIDVSSLKQSLTSIQNFSHANTDLLDKLQQQLTIVNERTNLHYNQLQNLVSDINKHQANFISDINTLIISIKNSTQAEADRIGINSIIISYSNSLFRIYQTIIDYRFAYIETLNSIQQHYHFPTNHHRQIDQQLKQRLNEYGYTIPTHGDFVPYTYSAVKYNKVIGINFYDLEFDIYIPVAKINEKSDNEMKYYYSQLSPLPIGINENDVIYNTYQGTALCNERYCYQTPISGFCKEGENYWYCSNSYINTLHNVTNLYTKPTANPTDALFIPPYTIYFVHNTTYNLDNQKHTAYTGSVLLLTCNSTLETEKGLKVNTKDFISCSDLYSQNVFIHEFTDNNNPDTFTLPTQISKLEEYYLKEIKPIITLNAQSNITIDNTADNILSQQYETLRKNFNEQITQLSVENNRILRIIGNMRAENAETPVFFYIIIGILILFFLRLFRII